MANIKVHIPFYDTDILRHVLHLVNRYKNVKVLDLDLLRGSYAQKYKKATSMIFANYGDKLILIGDMNGLPIPSDARVIVELRSAKRGMSKYIKNRYTRVSKRMLIHSLYTLVCLSPGEHTFWMTIRGKKFVGDVYKLWSLTKFMKPTAAPVAKIVKKLETLFGTSIEELQIWSNTTIANIRKHKSHYKRVKQADLRWPIIIYQGFVLDGYHRLVKAYLEGKKNIKVVQVNETLVKKSKAFRNSWKLLTMPCVDG